MMEAWVYMLLCEDGSYYTGWTNDVQRRFEAHRSGRGARYTRAHRPVRIAYTEAFEDQRMAMKREAALKKLSHAQKQKLALQNETKAEL